MSNTKQFYTRNIEISGACSRAILGRTIPNRGDRYFAVFDYLRSTGGQKPPNTIELGFGGLQNIQWISEGVGQLTLADLVDRTLGEKLPANTRFQDCDLNGVFPFEDGAADLVIALMVIEHLFDPFHSFSEVSRILRSDGVAIVNLPLVTSIKNRLRLVTGRLPITSRPDWFEIEEWDGGHLHYFSLASIRRLSDKYGLRLVEQYPVGKGIFFKKMWPAMFCGEISVVLQKC